MNGVKGIYTSKHIHDINNEELKEKIKKDSPNSYALNSEIPIIEVCGVDMRVLEWLKGVLECGGDYEGKEISIRVEEEPQKVEDSKKE